MHNEEESNLSFTKTCSFEKEYILNTRLRKYKRLEIFLAENIINMKETGYTVSKENYLYACEVTREKRGELGWDFLML